MKLRLAVAGSIAALLTLGLVGCSATGSGDTGASNVQGSADLKAAAATSTGIVVGTEGTYKPFSYHDTTTNQLTGYDVDVTKAVAKKLGVKVTFRETQWDGIFAALDSKRIDVIGNQVSITPERKAKYSFSTPYTVSPGVIITRADDTSITSFADLKGKTTAQSNTSDWYALAQKSGAKVEAVEGWAQAIALLQQGRIDATVNDKLTLLDYEKQNPNVKLRIAATADDPAENAFAFRKGSTLPKDFDKALAELRADGTLAKISKKYFGEDVSQ
ncbi:amino acid ABC transporter substrate-binding protein [Microbacterium sp. STN6]|uniref:amino acid ABC transporter substrate-binding protein n=1 Tax=Microbacterium sp. STN6 TaxID=2995588 RepID=UPI002260CE78|nr:amino acid ABC transporter substrate-binding protein [Microbacterium sp. STN6]MCX7521320.1 amino acid ABC transporter substrate-binding protein [Microbacterium sp. STN6]